jgi:hypothetical protein
MGMRAKALLILTLCLLIPTTGYCALSQNNLTNGYDEVDATSFTTASVTPSANALLLLTVSASVTGGSAAPTITGNGLTWVQVVTRQTSYGDSWDSRRITIFRAMGASPTTGTITIDFSGITQSRCLWSLSEFTGADTSGTDGSGAIVQSGGNDQSGGTSLTVTLSAFSSANNMAYGAIHHWWNEATTLGTGFSEIYDTTTSSGTTGFQTQYKLNDETVDWSWTTSVRASAIALEILASSGGGGGGGGGGGNVTQVIVQRI